LFSIGNRITSKKLAIQREPDAIAMAVALTLFGKISERTTQVTGASVIAYTAIPVRIKINTLIPPKLK